MIAIDDAAWAAPWRHVRVSQKVLLSVALIITALVSPPFPGAVLVAVSAVALILGSAKISARTLAIAFSVPAVFILIGALTITVQVGMDAVDAWWQLGPFSISRVSVINGLTVLARSTAGTLSIFVLATTTPMADLLAWFRCLGLPGPLVEIASLTYRLLFVLADSIVAINAAQAARLGMAPIGKNRHKRRWYTTAIAVSALMTRTWGLASRLTDGLAARGIEGDLKILDLQTAWNKRLLAATLGLLAGIWAICVIWMVL